MKKILFLVVGLCAGLSLSTAQEVGLSFNPDKGATYTYSYKIWQTIDQQLMGMDVNFVQEISMAYAMNVLEKNKEEVRVSFEYTDILYTLANPMMTIRYNSNKPVDNPTSMDEMVAKMYNCLIGRKFEAVIALDGTVKSLTGMDEVINEMFAAAGAAAGMAPGMEESLRAQMGNDALKKSFEQSLKIYPEEKVKVGDSWTVGQTSEIMNIQWDIENQYTLTKADKKDAMLLVESVISTSGENGLKGTQAGMIHLDRKTGMMREATIHQEIEGELSTQGMAIPLKIKSDVSITIRKK